MDIRTKKRLADYRIENSGTKRETEAQVREIYALLVKENERPVNKDQHRS
jgi:dephospho-CoA kinase